MSGDFTLAYVVSAIVDGGGSIHDADVRLAGVTFAETAEGGTCVSAARREEVLRVTGGGWAIL
jgi:hypothetical protein